MGRHAGVSGSFQEVALSSNHRSQRLKLRLFKLAQQASHPLPSFGGRMNHHGS